MKIKINYFTMDRMLMDMQKALVFLRDYQSLIACDEKHDICGDFDNCRDALAKLRRRFHDSYNADEKQLNGAFEFGQKHEFNEVAHRLQHKLSGPARNLWNKIHKGEDPGL
jgi:hypothetical protein